MRLPSPVLVGDGPTTYREEDLFEAFENGVGAVEVQASSSDDFERKNAHRIDTWQVVPTPRASHQVHGYFGVLTTLAIIESDNPYHYYQTKLDRILTVKNELGDRARLFASIGSCYYRNEHELKWGDLARIAVDAGADAVTLHLQTGNQLAGAIFTREQDALKRICEEVAAATDVPVIAKLPMEGCMPTDLVRIAIDSGCDAVMPTARFVGLDIDIEKEEPILGGHTGYGGSWVLPNLCSWVARMHQENPDWYLMPGGGISSGEDIIKVILAGANMAHVCSWPMMCGYEAISKALKEIETWMDSKGYASLADLRGKIGGRVTHAQKLWAHPRYENKGPFTGVYVDKDLCTGCNLCVPNCWFSALSMVGEGRDRKAQIDPEACVGCGCCVGACPFDAIPQEEGSVPMDWLKHV